MSVIGLTVEYRIGSESGPDSLQRMGVAFERAGAEVADFGKHVFPLLSPIFEAAETRQFDAQGGGPVAGSWAELSAVYADWKEQHYPGQPLLVATGALREGLTAASSPFGVREWTATNFVFGTAGIEYASFHQSGTSRMPARPPFDLDGQFESDLQQVARVGVNAAIREAGLEPFIGPISERP
jgi:phage gpG-like protein